MVFEELIKLTMKKFKISEFAIMRESKEAFIEVYVSTKILMVEIVWIVRSDMK